jgi:hypothetical protein
VDPAIISPETRLRYGIENSLYQIINIDSLTGGSIENCIERIGIMCAFLIRRSGHFGYNRIG